jgi:polyisoprenoid-binding protein YceI
MSAEVGIAGLLLAFVATIAASRPAEPREYLVDGTRSRLWVVTHRSGLLSFLGHEHAIIPEEWSAELCLDDPVPAGAAGSIVVQTSSLVVDSDAARAMAGLGDGPSEKDVREIQRKLLDADHLDADHHPEIRLDLVSVAASADGVVRVRAKLALRGITREFELPVRVEGLADRALQLTGKLQIRQRDFGIAPESIAGVVKVSNEVDLRFQLVAIPTTRPCRPPGREASRRKA